MATAVFEHTEAPAVAVAYATAAVASPVRQWLQVSSNPEATLPSSAELAAEDAAWDAVATRHAPALEKLFRELHERAARGEDSPLDLDEF